MRWSVDFLPVTSWSTSRCVWFSVGITRSIRTSVHSTSLARSRSRTPSKRPSPVLLEPIMRIEVVTPEEYMGAVNGDLRSRRGQIDKMNRVRAVLRSLRRSCRFRKCLVTRLICVQLTQGRATSTMHFERYEEAPKNVGEEIIAKVQGLRKLSR